MDLLLEMRQLIAKHEAELEVLKSAKRAIEGREKPGPNGDPESSFAEELDALAEEINA